VKPPFTVHVLGDHDRAGFSCGVAALDTYFKTQVGQDVRRRVTSCFVAVDTAIAVVAGFYTIAAASILVSELPESVKKKLPRYPSVPAIRVGRLAVDLRFRGRGLGGALLADAAARAINAEVAAFAMIVDAKDEAAAAFYERHGFRRLTSLPRCLFLALATAERALAGRGGTSR
jgi:ribosomal protein S18 acetylase RimI-like enzyme